MGLGPRNAFMLTTSTPPSLRRPLLCALILVGAVHAQVIDFESGGLRYKALTHNGMTIMFATLPTHVRDYAILQVAISNGSAIPWSVRPEDFKFERPDGTSVQALPAGTVVNTLLEKAGRGDVMKLIGAYEAGLYGNTQMRSTNGYESRRQNALAEVGSTKLKAAAAASAIALVATKLSPGQSTDGAVFYPNQGKPLGVGQLIVHAAGEEFVFPVEAEARVSR
jgi:hypothetical protein